MNKKINILSNVLTFALTLVALFFVSYVANERLAIKFGLAVVYFVLGAIICSSICTFLHELGHVLSAKVNNFKVLSFRVLFFKWERIKNKMEFSFAPFDFSAGFTECVAINTRNLEKRYKKITLSGVLATIIVIPLGVLPIVVNFLPSWAYCMWIMFIPMGIYSVCDNILPMISDGVKNDGAIIRGINKNEPSSKVLMNLLAIQSQMYSGKSPCEVDENLYFDVPQLPEDDINFFLLLNARYNYYLDKGDYENAKKTTARLLSLEEYAQKSHMSVVKADALYNACTFDYNEERADDLTYELEKFLNGINNVTNLRIKTAYILNVRKDYEGVEHFYKKGIKEAQKSQISGLGKFEQKLLEELYQKFQQVVNK